jgi:hypothetical protein
MDGTLSKSTKPKSAGRLTVLEVIYVIGWELSTRNLGSGYILLERASLDVLSVEKSFLFTTSRYTFGHRQQLRERSISQDI